MVLFRIGRDGTIMSVPTIITKRHRQWCLIKLMQSVVHLSDVFSCFFCYDLVTNRCSWHPLCFKLFEAGITSTSRSYVFCWASRPISDPSNEGWQSRNSRFLTRVSIRMFTGEILLPMARRLLQPPPLRRPQSPINLL